MLENRLEDLYYNLNNPSAYAGAHLFQKAAEKDDRKKTKNYNNKVLEWLERQKAYTLHKPVRWKFPRRMYNVRNVADLYEIDLADFRNLKNYNDDYKYVLVCIDVLSKFVFAEALYNKSAQSVAAALEKIFEKCGDKLPLVVQSDKGTEFRARETQKVFKKYDISFRETKNDVKASVIERFIRTLKTRMWRYFSHKNTYRYIDVLEKIIRAYNFTVHSATLMAPAVVTRENAKIARENLIKRYGQPRKRRKNEVKYAVGDLVRVSREKKIFGKGYEDGYTTEIFRIIRVSKTRDPIVYYLEDLKKEPIDCFFYAQELSRVSKSVLRDGEFEIEEILDTRGKGRNKEVLVRWLGYSSKFDSWIKASAVVDI